MAGTEGVLKMNTKIRYLSVLRQDDFQTITLALEREQRTIIELLNSGKVIKDDQDKALRSREYTINELLGRLINPGKR